MIKLFLDTEFTGLHQNTSLISIGIISLDGRKFYAEFTDYDREQVSDWVQTNVIEQLEIQESSFDLSNMRIKGDRSFIKSQLEIWFSQFKPENKEEEEKPFIEMWGDVPHWDWVLFCELFGGAFGIPSSIHYMPLDIATLLSSRGIDHTAQRSDLLKNELEDENCKTHNALYDATMAKMLYEKYF